jgi:fatty-acyl-CoA synthase
VPVQLYFVDTIPLTAVGKVFKPSLRWDAAERAVRRMLAPVAGEGCTIDVAVGNHAEHGTLITVTLGGESAAARALVEQRVHEKLDPLPLKHIVVAR